MGSFWAEESQAGLVGWWFGLFWTVMCIWLSLMAMFEDKDEGFDVWFN